MSNTPAPSPEANLSPYRKQLRINAVVGGFNAVEDDIEYSDPDLYYSDEYETNSLEEMTELDLKNLHVPQMVPQYAERIFNTSRSEEEEELGCYTRFLQLGSPITSNMRATLIRWITDLHYCIKMTRDGLHSAVKYLDILISKRTTKVEELQMFGCVCLWISGKMDQRKSIEVSKFIEYSNNGFTREQFLEAEFIVLQTLNFKLDYPTAYSFINRFLLAVSADKPTRETAHFLCEASLLVHELVDHRVSVVAVSAVVLALILNKKECPYECLMRYSKCNDKDLIHSCAHLISIEAKSILQAKKSITYQKYTDFNSTGILSTLDFDLAP